MPDATHYNEVYRNFLIWLKQTVFLQVINRADEHKKTLYYQEATSLSFSDFFQSVCHSSKDWIEYQTSYDQTERALLHQLRLHLLHIPETISYKALLDNIEALHDKLDLTMQRIDQAKKASYGYLGAVYIPTTNEGYIAQLLCLQRDFCALYIQALRESFAKELFPTEHDRFILTLRLLMNHVDHYLEQGSTNIYKQALATELQVGLEKLSKEFTRSQQGIEDTAQCCQKLKTYLQQHINLAVRHSNHDKSFSANSGVLIPMLTAFIHLSHTLHSGKHEFDDVFSDLLINDYCQKLDPEQQQELLDEVSPLLSERSDSDDDQEKQRLSSSMMSDAQTPTHRYGSVDPSISDTLPQQIWSAPATNNSTRPTPIANYQPGTS